MGEARRRRSTDQPARPRRADTEEEAFARRVLTLIVESDHGLMSQEVAQKLGVTEEEVEAVVEKLEANGYLNRQARARH
jgi:Mn-dependent DtxR family transcriptional regulator